MFQIPCKFDGKIFTVPAYSPEHGPRTMGNTYEQSLIWQLFNDTIEAANILGKDGEFAGELQNAIEKLNPIEIGESGQIKEWYCETKLGHKHFAISMQWQQATSPS